MDIPPAYPHCQPMPNDAARSPPLPGDRWATGKRRMTGDGLGLAEIEGKTGLNRRSCLQWRKRFLALAGTTPGDGGSRWSVRKLAEADRGRPPG